MAYIDWNPQLSTGNKTIDDQHKNLISLINDLYEAMKSGKASSILEHILSELSNYTGYHFSTEEKAFDLYKYSHAAEHKMHHDDLIKQVVELQAKVAQKQIAISIDVLNFLNSWVKNHIIKEDMQYRDLLIDKDLSKLP